MLLNQDEVIQGPKGRYQIQARIGSESSFGAVYKALDQSSRPVVVKQLLGLAQAGSSELDYDYVKTTFEREAQILMRHNHPQIVKGYDFFEHEEYLILVMEFINGQDLDQILIKRLAEKGPFSEPEAVAIGVETGRIIHTIHQMPGQILYRDLKPRNLMWDAAKGQIKIIDFGTARFMTEGLRATKALGTPGYAPPEYYSTGNALSFASDVYTIGATLYELVTGEPPEPMATPSHFHGYESQLSESFRSLLVRAMDQDPQRRFHTAKAFAEALAALPAAANLKSHLPSARNPYPYLSCMCPACGNQPVDSQSVFCSQCGHKIHVLMLRVEPANPGAPAMDLFLDKNDNVVGRQDLENKIFPDVDLARYDPGCFVSRQHCRLRRDGTRFYLEAFPSTNPTKVNGFPLSEGKTLEISPETQITLANLSLTFRSMACIDAS